MVAQAAVREVRRCAAVSVRALARPGLARQAADSVRRDAVVIGTVSLVAADSWRERRSRRWHYRWRRRWRPGRRRGRGKAVEADAVDRDVATSTRVGDGDGAGGGEGVLAQNIPRGTVGPLVDGHNGRNEGTGDADGHVGRAVGACGPPERDTVGASGRNGPRCALITLTTVAVMQVTCADEAGCVR